MVFSYLMKNLSYIPVIEVTFLRDLVMLLLYALLSLITVKKEKNHLFIHCILDLIMYSQD